MKLTEIGLYGSSISELSTRNKSGFGIPKVENVLFNDFQKVIDLEIEEKML